MVARAIENQCYVLAAAQVGQHNEKRQSYGHSVGKSMLYHLLQVLILYVCSQFIKLLIRLAYDPWGELLADAGGYDGEGLPETIINTQSSQSNEQSPVHVPSVIMADIDLDKLDSVRERMPIQQHRGKSSFS